MDKTTSEANIFDPADFANSDEEQQGVAEPVQESVDEPASQNGEDKVAASSELDEKDNTDEQANEPDVVADFLAKKGLKADDPDILNKVVGIAQNAEKMGKEATQKRAALERNIASRDNTTLPVSSDVQALAEVRSMRTEQAVAEWRKQINPSPEIEQKMVEYINQPLTDQQGNVAINPQTGKPFTKGVLVVNGTLSLNDVYHMVGGGESSKVTELRTKYQNEVRKEIAAHQSAKRPSPKATNSTQFGDKNEADPFLDGLLGN